MGRKFTVIDLFSGAGGLSLGFRQTQKYDIKAAFENSPYMRETYHRNHPDVEIQGDVCTADYADIKRRYGDIDVVIGGPPCQGFSNANRQKSHAVSRNNKLVKQYLRAILELQPKAFVMENVSMLCSEIHRFYMEKGDEEMIARCEIPVKDTAIHLLDAEFMFENAAAIVQSEEKVKKYLWADSDYFELNIIYKASRNIEKMSKALGKHKDKLLHIAERFQNLPENDYILYEGKKALQAILNYYEGTLDISEIKGKIERSIMIQRMLGRAWEIFENRIVVDEFVQNKGLAAKVRSFAIYDYLCRILESPENGYVTDSDVLCAADFGAPQKRRRFVMIGIKKSISPKIALPIGRLKEKEYRTVKDAISDLEEIEPVTDVLEDKDGIMIPPKEELTQLASVLRDSPVLKNHIITKTTDTAMERFRSLKQGQNFHALDSKLKTNTYTDASRTQNTIYLRLNYDEPSGTVVNVRKSMWIHPVLDRAVSVREAARLQTFPDSFIFCGSKDKQYQQVGNAVPPIMAKTIAKKLAQILTKNLRQTEKQNG